MTNSQDALQLIMIGILLLCGYIFLFQLVARKTENKNSVPVIAIVLLLIYLMIVVPVILIIRSMGSTEMMLIAVLLLFACAALFFALYGLAHNFRQVNKGMLALFLAYMLAVGYITMFSRDQVRGNSSKMGGIYLFRFEMIEEAIRQRSLQPLNHMLLNVAMFVPFGFLLPLICPEKLSRWSYALMMGLMFTTLIEFTQMMLRLGQADLTDIVTNVLGALIGYLFYRLYARIRGNREADEEE